MGNTVQSAPPTPERRAAAIPAAEFPMRALDYLTCPRDAGRLAGREGLSGDSLTHGQVGCEKCGTTYAIEEGILDLLGHQQVQDEAVRTEILIRDEQAEDYESRLFNELRNEMEIPSLLHAIGSCAGLALLDIGAGTGRVTRRLLPGCNLLLAVDFSRESLKRLALSMGSSGNLALVLADVTGLRLPSDRFDRVVSTQVLEHIPALTARAGLYRTVNAALKPGGRMVCTAYHFGPSAWGRGREGFHSSGIYFRRFTISDLRREIALHLEVDEVRPIVIRLPLAGHLARHLGLPPGWFSRRAERLPVVRLLGDLLLATAGKRPDHGDGLR